MIPWFRYLIHQYVDESLLRLKEIQAIKRPTERAQRNLYKMISNTQSLVTDESDWIREGPDLAALGSHNEHGWLNTFLEDVLSMLSTKVTMVYSGPMFLDKTYTKKFIWQAELGNLSQFGAKTQDRGRRTQPSLRSSFRYITSDRIDHNSSGPASCPSFRSFQTSTNFTIRVSTQEQFSNSHGFPVYACFFSFMLYIYES